MFTRLLGDNDALRGHAYYFPFHLRQEHKQSNANQHQVAFGFKEAVHAANEPKIVPNASGALAQYVKSLNSGAKNESMTQVWFHTLAITYSRAYLSENTDGVRENWPRIPLPNSAELLKISAGLGQEVSALLDTETSLNHVTTGNLLQEMKLIGQVYKTDGKILDEREDLKITAAWGHAGKDGVTMPGQGKLIERERTEAEIKSLIAGNLDKADVFQLLGETTCDVYLNNSCMWKNIPTKVWEFFIGGYQVIKKWLSYRHFNFISRPLSPEEADEVTAMARRLTSLCLMQPKLDANYFNIKAAAYSWPQPSSEAEPAIVAVDLES